MDENYLPVVVGAALAGDRVLRPLLSDGTVGDVDFSSERRTGALEPLNDPAYRQCPLCRLTRCGVLRT